MVQGHGMAGNLISDSKKWGPTKITCFKHRLSIDIFWNIVPDVLDYMFKAVSAADQLQCYKSCPTHACKCGCGWWGKWYFDQLTLHMVSFYMVASYLDIESQK
jgi:hypothetical protein